MKALLAVVDRTAVLFLGVAAGAAIGYAFAGGSDSAAVRPELLALPVPQPAPGASAATGAPPAGAIAAADGTIPALPGAAPAPALAPRVAPAAAPEVVAALQGTGLDRQQLLRTVAEARPIRVGVFGDSFGDGVWSGLNRLLPRKAGFEVVKYSQQATGFTRYRSLNLEAHAAEQLGAAPLDVAVISYGANDIQGVITDSGKVAALMTPGWQAAIGARVDRYVRLMRAHGAMVYWVGLPRMRKASYDADVQAMNAFYARRMAALGVPYIDSRLFASGPDGEYEAYLPDPRDGTRTLIRADDGIHMSMNGYIWITRDLAGRIRAYVDAAKTVSARRGGGEPPVPLPAVTLAAAPLPPAEPLPPAPAPEEKRAPAEPKRDFTPAPRPDRAERAEKRATAALNRAEKRRTAEAVEADAGSDQHSSRDDAAKRDADESRKPPRKLELPKGLVPEPDPEPRR